MLKADGKPWLPQCLERDTAPESSLLPREPWAWLLSFFIKNKIKKYTHTHTHTQEKLHEHDRSWGARS